jgi:hypothetical protein
MRERNNPLNMGFHTEHSFSHQFAFKIADRDGSRALLFRSSYVRSTTVLVIVEER